MTNKQVARILQETADLIELTGGNTYRARAFRGAARSLSELDEPVTERAAAGTLTEIPGVGSGLAADINELLETNSLSLRKELLDQVPPGLLEVLRVKGLGVKRARQLWEEADVTSLEELEFMADSGRLSRLDGFGSKMQAKVLKNIRQLKDYRKQRRFAATWEAVSALLTSLRDAPGVSRAEATGALRRHVETLDSVELLVTADEPGTVRELLDNQLDDGTIRAGDGDLLCEGSVLQGLPLSVRLVPRDRFGTVLWERTGSEKHCSAFHNTYGAPGQYESEDALFKDADLPYIPPEIREDTGELEAARQGSLPALLTMEDLQGILHNHSTYSDGAHSLRRMAEATRELGYTYFGICDHSQSLTIANGLTVDDVRRQQEEIRELNEMFAEDSDRPFRVFSGTESDILKDGSLDYPDDVLASFDFVVGSVHSGFNMSREEATRRLITAIENPYTAILGHATGRLLLSREGYPIDHTRVIEACAEHDVAIEFNANPYRLDMDWRYLQEAVDAGVLVSINPDAHAVEELHHLRWGVAVARKGWVTPESCLNAKPFDAFTEWIETQKAKRPS